MALSKNTSKKSHAAQFVSHLDRNSRNALIVILSHASGPHDLREALGIVKHAPISHETYATGCARRGETVRLFKDHMQHSAANLNAESASLEVR